MREMQRVPQILELPVIEQGSGPPASELQGPEEFDLVLGGVGAQGLVIEEPFKAWFQREGLLRFLFDKFKTLAPAWS
jgi:hypothetical protein